MAVLYLLRGLFLFRDYMKSVESLAALLELPVKLFRTYHSFRVGEGKPTHQPTGHALVNDTTEADQPYEEETYNEPGRIFSLYHDLFRKF
ncbi:hypothetical protein QQ020_35760 [Fulvivirgaceae bacterium BMA12]|uniref:Uncharacterized protein n=1 Tax=Agaribacillus aureus TaxID=3051825 RepID=A0ABT8LI55_9BACT|nr:hypothetical protein [Fulvivirgaceae bacterium BMA12]